MRVLLGLAALASAVSVDAAVDLVTSGANTGGSASSPPVGTTALTRIQIRAGSPSGASLTGLASPSGAANTLSPAIDENAFLNSNNWVIFVANTVTAINFRFNTNTYTAQIQYRWSPDYLQNKIQPWNAGHSTATALTQQSYWCDICTGLSSPTQCNTATGPGAGTPASGFPCANMQRDYLFTGLQASTLVQFVNSVSFQLFDINTNPAPNSSSYSFQVVRATSIIVGDPQIVGMQGQDFQVHGMPDEIFNIVSYPSLQVNARFTYLESAECNDNFTACFAHPGTYISEEGIRVGKDKIRVQSGSFKKGLTVTVNGKKAHKNVDLKHGAVEIVNHRRVVIHTDVMKISVSNSDKFLNQELELADDKLISLGSSRTLLKDNERFHPEVPLHGLQGQTWRNVEYASGLEYEGSIMDYHVVDGNLFGTDFVFNQFQS